MNKEYCYEYYLYQVFKFFFGVLFNLSCIIIKVANLNARQRIAQDPLTTIVYVIIPK